MHSLKTFTTSLRLRNYISSTTKVVPLLLTEGDADKKFALVNVFWTQNLKN